MHTQDFVFRLAMALLMGAAVGLERQIHQRMAGTRTNALVSAGAAAFVMCAFLTQDSPRAQAQIVANIVSGVGFLGAGVIFKEAGSVRGLNTAATIWCSAAIGATTGLGNPHFGLAITAAVLTTNVVLRPLANRLYRAQDMSQEHDITYSFELTCRPEDEPHMRAQMFQALAGSPLTLIALRSEDIEGTNKMKITAQIKGLGRQDQAMEQLVMRASLEAGVSSVSWALHSAMLE